MDFPTVIGNFRKTKLLVVGDLILDHFIWGRVERISPEAPVPVVEVTHDTFMLGGAANVASNIVSLGGHATVAGVVGRDAASDVLRGLLKQRGIGFRAFEDKRPTTVKTRVIAHNQQVVRFDKEKRDGLGGKTFGELLSFIKAAVKEHDGVIVSDYKKGVVSSALIREILKAAGKKKFVALDPKVGHFHLYKGVSVITPNLHEASEGSGIKITDRKTLLRAGRRLKERLGCKAVLITMGEQGMALFEGDRTTQIPTTARKVYDVTGAGDTVIAALSLALASGAGLLESAIISNHAAGLVVAEVGTVTASPAALRRSLRNPAAEFSANLAQT